MVVGQGVMWVVVGGSEGWVGGGGGRRRKGEKGWSGCGGGVPVGAGWTAAAVGVATAVACHPFSQTRHERGIFGFLLLNIPLGKT